MLCYILGRGFVCTPFPDRSAHRSSRESAPGWVPSIAKPHSGRAENVSDLISLLDISPWGIPIRRDLLSLAAGMIFNPCSELWKLWVWPLRGHNLYPLVSQLRLLRPSSNLGKARQGKFICIAHFIHIGNSKCFT